MFGLSIFFNLEFLLGMPSDTVVGVFSLITQDVYVGGNWNLSVRIVLTIKIFRFKLHSMRRPFSPL